MRPSDKVRKLKSDRNDVLSILNYVIKKGPSDGARHWNTERQRTYHAAHVSPKKAEKKGYTSQLDRFLKCPISRLSQMDIGWTEDHCARLDEIAAEDHSFIATGAERTRRENTWVLVLNSSGPNGPVNQREDCQEAYIKNQAPQTQDFILENKFDSDWIDHSLGTMKALSVSTQSHALTNTHTFTRVNTLAPSRTHSLTRNAMIDVGVVANMCAHECKCVIENINGNKHDNVNVHVSVHAHQNEK